MTKEISADLKSKIDLLIKQKNSNLTISQFERENNIPDNSFYGMKNEILGMEPTEKNLLSIKISQSIYAYTVLHGLTNRNASKLFSRSTSVIGSYKKFYENLPYVYPYIRDNKIDLPTYQYAWEALKHIQNDNYEALIDHDVLNSVRRNQENEPEKKFFQQLKPIDIEPPKKFIEAPPQQYHIEPSNQITLTTSSGVKVYVPESIDDEKLIKLTRFIRSL